MIETQRYALNDSRSSSQFGTTVTAAGTINTLGTIVQLDAAAECDAEGFLLSVGNQAGTVPAAMLIDLLAGAGGSERPILQCLSTASGVGGREFSQIYVPIPIAKDTRISARLQASALTSTIVLGMQLVAGGFPDMPTVQRNVSLGVSTSTSLGTTVDPGGTANTKGAWVQLGAAGVPFDVKWIILSVCRNDATMTSQQWRVDIGRGATSNQYVVIPDMAVQGSGSSDDIGPKLISLPLYVPSGGNLWIRCQSSLATVAERELACSAIVLG